MKLMPIKFLDPETERRLTSAQLETYDRYLDAVRTHNTFLVDAFERGRKEGLKRRLIEIAKKMIVSGMTTNDISNLIGLSIYQIESLK